METGFRIEQCMHALFECPEDVNEITKNPTIAVSCKKRFYGVRDALIADV